MKSNVFDIILYSFLLVLMIIFNLNFCTAIVNGESMYPTLHENSFILVHKTHNIKNGDIIITNDSIIGKNLIKRAIGIPNDTVEFKDNKVFVNNVELIEDYINKTDDIYYSDDIVNVDSNSYYIMGDNRNNSMDSRSFGVVNEEEIIGVMIFDLSKIGITKSRAFVMFITIALLLILSVIFTSGSSKGDKKNGI